VGTKTQELVVPARQVGVFSPSSCLPSFSYSSVMQIIYYKMKAAEIMPKAAAIARQ
jgi:hypothetical protein